MSNVQSPQGLGHFSVLPLCECRVWPCLVPQPKKENHQCQHYLLVKRESYGGLYYVPEVLFIMPYLPVVLLTLHRK